jgi:hypothetical protein
MADLPTRDSKVAVSAAGTTYTSVGGVKDIGDWSIQPGKGEVTDKDSGGFKEYLGGDVDMSFSINGNYNEDDAGQGILITAALARTLLYFRFRPSEATGKYEFIARGIVGFKVGSPGNDGACPFSCDVQLSGTPTHQLQS